jgi:hypothetical protein
MELDRRYKTVAKLIKTGQMDSFLEIFQTVPKTVVKTDMHMHHDTFTRRLKYPESFTLKEMVRLATLIGVNYMSLIELIYKQYTSKKNSKSKK